MNKKAQIEMYFESPLYQAWMPQDPGVVGMGYAIVARKTRGGAIVGVNFLCDHYCLGVKDCLPFLESEAGYYNLIQKFQQQLPLVQVEPAYLKKYVLDLVAWAKESRVLPVFGIPLLFGHPQRHSRRRECDVSLRARRGGDADVYEWPLRYAAAYRAKTEDIASLRSAYREKGLLHDWRGTDRRYRGTGITLPSHWLEP